MSLGLTSVAQAQINDVDIPGKLIYIRSAPLPARGQVVALSAKREQVFTIPYERCATVSTNGSYVVFSSLTGDDLIVYDLHSEEVIMQRVWDTRWQPCLFYWPSDILLRLHDREIGTKVYYLDVLTETIAEYDSAFQTYVPPVYSQLPDWLPDTEVLPSPNGNLILYQRCNSKIEILPDRVNCISPSSSRSYTDWVIYDMQQMRDVQILRNDMDSQPDFYYYGTAGLGWFTWDGTRWSPDGRYLAYLKMSRFPLLVYDTFDQQYLDTTFVHVDIDKRQGFHWSPDSSKVAFQVVGRLDESRVGDDEQSLRELVIFDVEKPNADAFQSADTAYNINDSSKIYWSPNSQALAFVDVSKNLIYVDALTGQTIILDQGVGRIVAWIPETS